MGVARQHQRNIGGNLRRDIRAVRYDQLAAFEGGDLPQNLGKIIATGVGIIHAADHERATLHGFVL